MTTPSAPGVDAHHHVWQLARGDYGWLTPALAPIYRDFGLADLAPSLAEAGIGDGTYGYSIEPPLSLKDGRPHQVSVRITGTDVLLREGMKSLTCQP